MIYSNINIKDWDGAKRYLGSNETHEIMFSNGDNGFYIVPRKYDTDVNHGLDNVMYISKKTLFTKEESALVTKILNERGFRVTIMPGQ